MFVTDTMDAAYPPEEYDPEAIMDRLAEIMSEHRQSNEVSLVVYDHFRRGSDDFRPFQRHHSSTLTTVLLCEDHVCQRSEY